MMNGSKEYKYIFSLVIAVYNCDPFLRETLDSVVNQDLSDMYRYVDGAPTEQLVPFEAAVQVIMVDDGSKDQSGAICDEYAAKYPNFKVIHKPNGGVASARNAGLPYIEGKYMNFLDSDDKFSPNVLSVMYKFFEENYHKTDVITMPLVFFDATEGEHWQNYKFREEARVVDLFNEYDSPLMFVNASFFKSEYKDKVEFCDKLVCGEDIRYISEILSYKMTMGLVPDCHYDYRRRSSGEESLIQTSKKKPGWYFDYFTYLVDWAVDFCREKWGYIPGYYQNILVSDLKWRFINDYYKTAVELLGEDKFAEYKNVLSKALGHFDDKYILELRGVFSEHKYAMLTYKYGRHADLCVYEDDVRLRFNNTLFSWLSNCYTLYEFLNIENGSLIIEGYTTLLGCSEDEEPEIFFEVTDSEGEVSQISTEPIAGRDVSVMRLGEKIYPAFTFRGAIPMEGKRSADVALVLIFRGHRIVKKEIRYGLFSPIGKEYKNSYFAKDGYIVKQDGNVISFAKASPRDIRRRERAFLSELKHSENLGAKKAYYAIKLAKLMKRFTGRKIWLISDRDGAADDNGEALFEYMSRNPVRGVKPYFVIDADSPDMPRLQRMGRVISPGSHKYKFLYLCADRIISSHSEGTTINPFNRFSPPYRRFIADKKFVFLQHGITKNDVSRWFNKYRVNFAGFITAAEPERRSILEYNYFYDEGRVWLTGFSRFDRLYNSPKKIIAVAPTWRAYLLGSNGYDPLDEAKFMASNYYKFFERLFTDESLAGLLKDHGFELRLKPHPRMAPYLDLLKEKGFKLYGDDVSYRQMFAEASLFVTDYSSASFDFAYLRKPLIYTQFDLEEFYTAGHTYDKGYFDDERDGFGEVLYDYDSTVKAIEEYVLSGCVLKDKYRARIDSFFAFDDKDNCKRIIEKIKSI